MDKFVGAKIYVRTHVDEACVSDRTNEITKLQIKYGGPWIFQGNPF